MENVKQLIVEDLNKHRGLSVDTIVKMSNTIENIENFKLLTNMIEKKFEGLDVKFKASVENKSPFSQKSVYIDQQKRTPLRKPNNIQKTNYKKTVSQLNTIRRAKKEKYERLKKKQKSERYEEENTRNQQTKKKQEIIQQPIIYF